MVQNDFEGRNYAAHRIPAAYSTSAYEENPQSNGQPAGTESQAEPEQQQGVNRNEPFKSFADLTAAYWQEGSTFLWANVFQRHFRAAQNLAQMPENDGGERRRNAGNGANSRWSRFELANFDRYTAFVVTEALLYIAQLAINFCFQIARLIFQKISGFLYRALLYVVFLVLKYTVLAPILAPYYAARAYLRRAELIWRTSQSVWAFLCRAWFWLSGGQNVRREMNAQIRRQTGASMEEGENEAKDPRMTEEEEGLGWPYQINIGEYAVWLLLYLPVVFSVFWLFYHYYWPAWFLEKFHKIFPF